jgi:hypothetical protein
MHGAVFEYYLQVLAMTRGQLPIDLLVYVV